MVYQPYHPLAKTCMKDAFYIQQSSHSRLAVTRAVRSQDLDSTGNLKVLIEILFLDWGIAPVWEMTLYVSML